MFGLDLPILAVDLDLAEGSILGKLLTALHGFLLGAEIARRPFGTFLLDIPSVALGVLCHVVDFALRHFFLSSYCRLHFFSKLIIKIRLSRPEAQYVDFFS